MERYSHLQALPNSPLSPLTPLCENTAFDFNFGGDGSLDAYIDNIRQKHLVEQHQKTSMATADGNQAVPKRYSEKFLRLRDVFEPKAKERYIKQDKQEQFEVSPCRLHLTDPPKKHCCHTATPKENLSPVIDHHKDCEIFKKQQQQQAQPFVTPKAPVQIVVQHTEATPNKFINDYVATPKNVRNHLKQRNSNISVNQPQKLSQHTQQMRKQKYRAFLEAHLGSPNNRNQPFRQASPVAIRPLCPGIAKILKQCGLTMYCGLFQREEIDMLTFQLLQHHDLQQMGVTDAKHCDMLMTEVREVRYGRQHF